MKTHTILAVCLLFLASQAHALNINTPCPVTNGPLVLNVVLSRISGTCISNCTVWVDSTGTTDSSLIGAQTVTQDVTFTIDYGDTLTSGTSKWIYGSNPGQNSRRYATGIIGAHMYATEGRDTRYTITVSAQDPLGNKATCGLGLQVFDQLGAKGFATKICQSPSGNFTGCPASATHSTSAAESTNLSTSMTNKMVLFHCGETFTGGANIGGTGPFYIGAYGGCQGTQSNRPIFQGNLTAGTGNVVDGRVNDIDFESTGAYAMTFGFPGSGSQSGPLTLYNDTSSGNSTSYYIAQSTQWALVQMVMSNMTTNQGVFLEYGENNCSNLTGGYPCTTGAYQNINYGAVLGGHYDGTGVTCGPTTGCETIRISACRLCVVSNNDVLNANTFGAVFKFHNGNTFGSACTWVGQWTEYAEISDNFFGGQSGSQLVEVTPQNQVTDERMRLIVIERNVFHQQVGSNDALSLSAMSTTVRDNVFNKSSVATIGVKSGNRGFSGTSNNTGSGPCAGTGTTTAPTLPRYPQFVEIYNNTCYAGGACFSFNGGGEFNGGPGNDSVAQNNLVYQGTVSSNLGNSNIISNNTTTTANNPGFTNGSGTFNVISDFKPTANFSGGTAVPVVYDGVLTSSNPYGTPWGPNSDLGAVKH